MIYKKIKKILLNIKTNIFIIDNWKIFNTDRRFLDFYDKIKIKKNFKQIKKINLLNSIKCYILAFNMFFNIIVTYTIVWFFFKNTNKHLRAFFFKKNKIKYTNAALKTIFFINLLNIKKNKKYKHIFNKLKSIKNFKCLVIKIYKNYINLLKKTIFIKNKLHIKNGNNLYFFINKKITNIKTIKNNIKNNTQLKFNNVLSKPIVFGLTKINSTSSILKKQKIYTKNKFSRSRQYCKNIVLFGLLLNIILMFGLNSAYYAHMININYFIGVVYLLFTTISIFIVLKYKLYKLNNYIC